MPINKPSQPLIPPTDVEEVEEIATSAAEAAIAADDTHAPLVDNLVPAANLPSYVDDVLEFASTSVFPDPGEAGKIYVALDTNNTYRWSGSAYVQVGGSEIDLTPYALKTEVAAAVGTKQDTLVSGTNIKTVNGESVLGDGDIEIGGDTIARAALVTNGINIEPTYTSVQGNPYYFGGEYDVSDLSSDDEIIDLAINEQVTPNPDLLPPLFIIYNSKSGGFEITTNNGSSHEIAADDEEHEIDLDGFQICYQSLSTSVPQEGLDQPDLQVVNSITVYYNYPGSQQFIESRSSNQVLQLTYNTDDLITTAQDLYNDLYFVRNRGLDNCIPKIPVLINTDNSAVADECYVQFDSSTEAFLCGSNGTIGFAWHHDKDLGELAVEIDWSLYNIGGGSTPTVDSEIHTLTINDAPVSGALTTNVTNFQCDDLEPNVWWPDTAVPTTILFNLTMIDRNDNQWAAAAPITCYRVTNRSYDSTSWHISYAPKEEQILLTLKADGCNFIDNKGNIAFTLSGLDDPQYNLYTKAPDVLMPIPAENGSIDPSTLPVFTIDPTAGGNRLFGDVDMLYHEDTYYSGYGPMVPNVIFQLNDEEQFGQIISKTEDSYQNTVITVRLLDDQFNPLNATMVITDVQVEDPGNYELRYVINTKQLWCDTETPSDWDITTNYITDGWLAFTTVEEPLIL